MCCMLFLVSIFCLFSDELFLHFGSFCFMVYNMHWLSMIIVCCCMFCFACYFMLFTTLNPENSATAEFAGLKVAPPLKLSFMYLYCSSTVASYFVLGLHTVNAVYAELR